MSKPYDSFTDADFVHVKWSYFDRFDPILDKYLPEEGDGDSLATQIVAATQKLIYMYYQNGDYYDNYHTRYPESWNDVSGYANWLHDNTDAGYILDHIFDTATFDGGWGYLDPMYYEYILKGLADHLLNEDVLTPASKLPKVGDVYAVNKGIFECRCKK